MTSATTTAWVLLLIAMAYGAFGVVFAGAFVFRGAGRIDPVARHASLGFKLLIVPGAAALWPILLARWRRAGRGPRGLS